MKLILRWHLTNLGHSDDKEEIIISSLVLSVVFPLKTIYRGNDSDGPDGITGSQRWLYNAVRNRQPALQGLLICGYSVDDLFGGHFPHGTHSAFLSRSIQGNFLIILRVKGTCLLFHKD